MDVDKLGEFVAILWECWSATMQGIGLFNNRLDWNLSALSQRAIAFVHSFKETRAKESSPLAQLPFCGNHGCRAA